MESLSKIGGSMLLTCYAEERGGAWEAVCLDFDLAAGGKTFDETLVNLRGAVALYLERVAELPEAEQARFLGRRVPLRQRLRFLVAVAGNILRPRRAGRPSAEFMLPYPA